MVNRKEALDGAIFAINTWMHPDASEQTDIDWMEEHADEIIEVLAKLRTDLQKPSRVFTGTLLEELPLLPGAGDDPPGPGDRVLVTLFDAESAAEVAFAMKGTSSWGPPSDLTEEVSDGQ